MAEDWGILNSKMSGLMQVHFLLHLGAGTKGQDPGHVPHSKLRQGR